MPQSEFIPNNYSVLKIDKSPSLKVHLQSEASNDEPSFDFTFTVLKNNLFLTTFTSSSHPEPHYPTAEWSINGKKAIKIPYTIPQEKRVDIDLTETKVTVDWEETPVVTIGWTNASKPIHADLPGRSYVVDGPGIAHYTRHDRNALHVGLGEKAAPMDLTGRHFILSTSDCFGYDVYKTDPMYKHIPLLIKATPEGCVGIFSTTNCRGTWSVGSEIDGLWGHFKVYRQDYGGLEEYLIIGKTIAEVLHTYAELVRFPRLCPRWAYGYISGGYKYTMGDDPPAYRQLLEFAKNLREHDIPCSAHQMSSGYSISEFEPKVRNVFTWNHHRFPDPDAWIAQYHALGIKLIANIKPFVLTSHSDYEFLSKAGALFKDPRTRKTAIMRLWSAGGGESGNGSHLDFTSAAAYEWWRKGVRSLKETGIDGMWNDNNEYTLPDDNWTQALDHPSFATADESIDASIGQWGRALHTDIMAEASWEGLFDVEPKSRPYVLTRSATASTMGWACSTWSGDNVTSWESMKGANALSLTAGMSLLHHYGHDIGGFEGPQPSPELLLRWVQLGIYSPRFAINCFKTSPQDNTRGEVIEPWMYPDITHLIRDAIKRRYEILPYIYSLGLESSLKASPPQRWVGWGYESDPEVWSTFLKRGEEQFWFGDSLLVGCVFSPGISKARIYLPRKQGNAFDYGFVNVNHPYQYLASGQWVSINSEWRAHIPLLAKIGGAIPVGKSVQTRSPGEVNSTCKTMEEDDYRGIEIFPPQGSSHGNTFSSTWYEDDGIAIRTDISAYTIEYSSTEEKIVVSVATDLSGNDSPPKEGILDLKAANLNGKYIPLWHDVDIILHNGDERHVVSGETGITLEKKGKDGKGRNVWTLKDVLKRS